MKYVFIALSLIAYLWEIVKVLVAGRQMEKPLPACVQGIYDDEAYARWRAYTHERRTFSLITQGISTLLTVAILAFDLLAWFWHAAGLDGMDTYLGELLLAASYCLLVSLLDIVPSYISTFRIEEKYGFNRSTKKTFWGDMVKNTVLNFLITGGLVMAARGFYDLMGAWLILALFLLLSVMTLVFSRFSLPMQRLFNRFEPLPEGTLRDRVNQLFRSNGYSVRDIYVMNASKRTSRANAFCTGIGRQKKIALYDNLVNNYTEDEIVAVFAHELGHDKHKDTTVLTLVQLLLYGVMALLIGGMLIWEPISRSLGFASVNAAAAILVLSMAVLDPVMTLLRIPVNLLSRRMERRADAFAAANGAGQALADALRKLARDSFNDLNRHPVIAAIEDSHPGVGERLCLLESLSGTHEPVPTPPAAGAASGSTEIS